MCFLIKRNNVEYGFEITQKIDFDYKEYTNENLSKFNEEFNKLKVNFNENFKVYFHFINNYIY